MFVPTHLDRGEGPHKRTILYVLYVCDAMEVLSSVFPELRKVGVIRYMANMSFWRGIYGVR